MHGGVANFQVGCERSYKGIRQPQPRLCDPRPRTTELWILFQRPLEKFQALPQFGLGALIGIKEAFKISIVGSCAARWRRRRDRQLEFQGINDGARYLILYRENSMHFALIGL